MGVIMATTGTTTYGDINQRTAGYAAADMLRHGDIINVVTYAPVNKMPASRWLCVGTPVVTGHPHVITEPVQ